MKCKCLRDYRDGNVDFKANEEYEFIAVPTSGLFPPVYKIHNGRFGQKAFTHSEFKTYFRRVA
jgi:hypothetical protein